MDPYFAQPQIVDFGLNCLGREEREEKGGDGRGRNEEEREKTERWKRTKKQEERTGS